MQTKQVKKLIRKYFTYWVHWTGLGYWSIKAVMSSEINERPNDSYLAGYCDVEWKYLTACITFYPKAMRHLTEEEIEVAVIHELMHVMVNETREGGMEHEERVCTQLQKAFSWVKGSLG